MYLHQRDYFSQPPISFNQSAQAASGDHQVEKFLRHGFTYYKSKKYLVYVTKWKPNAGLGPDGEIKVCFSVVCPWFTQVSSWSDRRPTAVWMRPRDGFSVNLRADRPRKWRQSED
uniref:Uncharacterized protein n=1 Tax=Tetranychus urticae TaxID=32264 RepID=T1KXF6_TETUR